MFAKISRLAAFGLVAITPVIACSKNSVIAEEFDTPAPQFVKPDLDGGDAEVSATAMCPVTTCPAPYATCASSQFPCDVNLLEDNDNCGECGVRCGGANIQFSQWTCVSGQCVFSCTDKGYRN